VRARGNIRVYGVWRENVTGPHSLYCLARFVIVRTKRDRGRERDYKKFNEAIIRIIITYNVIILLYLVNSYLEFYSESIEFLQRNL